MRACRLYGVRNLQLEDLPRPLPGPGEVLLQVASAGVCGSDMHYYLEGRIANAVITTPLVLGHEFSAWVAELGEGVRDLTAGQLVAVEPGIACGMCEPCLNGHPNLCPNIRFCGSPPCDGAFVEYVVMPAENCFPLPPELDRIAGALLEPLGVAIHSVDLAHMRPGYSVAVLGAGPIGLLIAAVARASGASEVYMSEPIATRRRFALDYAADVALDPGELDVAAEIRRLTKGRGVDVAFEAAGAPDTPQQAAEATRIGGTLIVAGIPVEDTMMLKASTIRGKGLTVKPIRRMKHTYPRAIHLVQRGAIDVLPIATHVFPLEQIADAFDMVAGYKDGILKAVIQVST
jgi:L-iditol 2-dehydrogenase